MFLIIAIYLAAAILTFFVMNSKSISWGQSKAESVVFSALCPIFYLMLVDWCFGDLIDRVEVKVFKKQAPAHN